MPTYDIEVHRDGQWWMITVPELNSYIDTTGAINLSNVTQAPHEGEVNDMARDFIATVLDIPISEVAVRHQST